MITTVRTQLDVIRSQGLQHVTARRVTAYLLFSVT